MLKMPGLVVVHINGENRIHFAPHWVHGESSAGGNCQMQDKCTQVWLFEVGYELGEGRDYYVASLLRLWLTKHLCFCGNGKVGLLRIAGQEMTTAGRDQTKLSVFHPQILRTTTR